MYQNAQSNEDEMTPYRMAVSLGLDLIQFWATEWVGLNGEGKWVEMEKFYWVRQQLFHSGPFVSSEQAFAFIRHYYYCHPEERSSEQGTGASTKQRIQG